MDDPAVAGCLAFLREGGPQANIVVGVAELLEDLGLAGAASDQTRPDTGGRHETSGAGGGTGPTARAVRAALIAGASGVDELVAATGLRGAVVLGALTTLEDQGLVVETFGRYHPAGRLAGKGPVRVSLPDARAGIEAA
jgi:predicted Rossmann fold nucleotide-binding protein DprA/Smf involved in DNA uptake